jgi:hypothetical protein
MKPYKNCQSCGMPFSKDELGGGLEMDGTKSTVYCSHCYNDGSFTLPNLTVEEMKVRVKEKIVEFGLPKFVAAFFTRNIQKLERWK